LALCLLVVSAALPSQDLRRAESGLSQDGIPIQKAWSALDSKSLSRQHAALLLLARKAERLSRPEIDRLTRRAIPVLGAGEKDLVEAVLKMCARQPYGPGNPDADTWGQALGPLLRHGTPAIARLVPRVILHRIPDSAVGRQLLLAACATKDFFVYEEVWFSLSVMKMTRAELPLVQGLLESRRKWCRLLGLDFLRDIHGGVLPVRYASRLVEMQSEGPDKMQDELPRCISRNPPARFLEKLVYMNDLPGQAESQLHEYLENSSSPGYRLTAFRVLRHFGKLDHESERELERMFHRTLLRETKVGFPVAWSLHLDAAARSDNLARMKEQLNLSNLIATPNAFVDKCWRAERRVLASLAKEQDATAARCESGWYACHRNAMILRGILAALDRKR